MKKTFLFALILLSSVLFAKEIKKDFSKVKKMDVKLVLGSCEFQKSSDGKIHVTVDYSFDEENFKTIFKEKNNKLSIEEKFEQDSDNDGESFWIISMPDDIDVEFSSATGNLSIKGLNAEFEGSSGTGCITIQNSQGEFELSSGTGVVEASNCEGEFELSSGTGTLKIKNCKGEIEASSGTGRVTAENITIENSSEFSSGTGKTSVKKISGKDFDLEISSGTGRAELDLEGKKVSGEYILEAQQKSGKIESSYKFDKEEEIEDDNSTRIRKSFVIGNSKSIISINSGTGKVILKK